jgi:hypothetical protein
MTMRDYRPHPRVRDTAALGIDLTELIEALAAHAHDEWAAQRLSDGWVWGESRCDIKKTHPCLVPYDQLPDTEKAYDRKMVLGTLGVVAELGYRLVKTS